jgi:hypothetical protein
MKIAGRTKTQLLDNLRNKRHWEVKEKLKIKIHGNNSLSIEHKEEIQVIFHKANDQ